MLVSSEQIIRSWDLITQTELFTAFDIHPSPVTAAVLMPNQLQLVIGTMVNCLIVWDLSDRTKIASLSDTARPITINALAVTPDGSQLIPATNETTIKIRDLNYSAPDAPTTGHHAAVTALVITADGTHAISAAFHEAAYGEACLKR